MSMFKKFHGECPPYNDKACWVCDPFECKAYMFGGERPGQQDFPTSDFYCLDAPSMTWRNLTKAVQFRRPNALMSREECTRDARELPRLALPACTLLRLHDTSFLLIFGGFDAEEEVPSSNLIIVNLRHHEWWFADIQGGPIAGRINPTIVSVGRNLYVFGGYRHFSGDGAPHGSYSIAELSNDGSTWKWEVRDMPYSSEVPRGTTFGMATPLYDGSKILLPAQTLTFTTRNIFCFHITRRKFQTVDLTGDFPEGIEWYSTYSLDASFNPVTPSTIVSTPPKRRGRPRKYPRLEEPSQSLSTSSQPTTSSSTSSVLICGWVDGRAEVWRLEVPSECFTKLDIGPMTGHSFEGSMLLGQRFWLLGSQGASDPSGSDSHSPSALVSNGVNYDIYMGIPLDFMDLDNS